MDLSVSRRILLWDWDEPFAQKGGAAKDLEKHEVALMDLVLGGSG